MNIPINSNSSVIGYVEFVSPSSIKVSIEASAPQSLAIRNGRPTAFPRVNSYILFPNEAGAVVGQIEWLAAAEDTPYQASSNKDIVNLPFGRRVVAITPLGTLKKRWNTSPESGYFEFERGVLAFPAIGDPALLPHDEHLRGIIEGQGANLRVLIGRAPLANNAPISIDPDKLFGRHLAILGNTGSGKSCSVSGLIRWAIESSTHELTKKNTSFSGINGRYIVLDPNGEYANAFEDLPINTKVLSVEAESGQEQLKIPAWMWNCEEWSAFLAAAPGAQRPILRQALRVLKGGAAADCSHEYRTLSIFRARRNYFRATRNDVSSHTSFPARQDFGNALRSAARDAEHFAGLVQDTQIVGNLDNIKDEASSIADNLSFPLQNGEGFNSFGETELDRILDAIEELIGNLPEIEDEDLPNEDAPIPFNVSDLPAQLETTASLSSISNVSQWIDLLRVRLRGLLENSRLAPVLAPDESPSLEEWLAIFLGEEDNEKETGQIVVVDLSLLPFEVLHLVIAVLSRLIFEANQRYKKEFQDSLPTLLVLEEAHTFLHYSFSGGDVSPGARECSRIFETIAREGRKFGTGLVLSSQRPSELSATVLAQCNSFLLHRIVNDRDQDLVRRLVPDNLGGLLSELPNLPSRQAVLLGWVSALPVLVEMRELLEEQRPKSDDPPYWGVWTREHEISHDWSRIVSGWKG